MWHLDQDDHRTRLMDCAYEIESRHRPNRTGPLWRDADVRECAYLYAVGVAELASVLALQIDRRVDALSRRTFYYLAAPSTAWVGPFKSEDDARDAAVLELCDY